MLIRRLEAQTVAFSVRHAGAPGMSGIFGCGDLAELAVDHAGAEGKTITSTVCIFTPRV